MTSPFRRRRQQPPLPGDYSDESITEMLRAAGPADWDGTTIEFTGASIVGLPEGVTAIAVKQHGRDTEPLARYQPAPAMFPALPPAPAPGRRPVLAPVPVTERAAIGDELRLPVIWCEMPSCISWHLDRESAGERDARGRAHAAGWRTDALGRLACPDCQQARSDYRTPRPVTCHHPEVPRRWYWHDPEVQRRWASGGHISGHVGLGEEETFWLGIEAELGHRVTREDFTLACAIGDATYRHHRTVAS